MKDEAKENLCETCLYGAQPYGYYPFVCVAGKRIRELWHDVFKCDKYVKPHEPQEEPKMTPWQVIKNKGCKNGD